MFRVSQTTASSGDEHQSRVESPSLPLNPSPIRRDLGKALSCFGEVPLATGATGTVVRTVFAQIKRCGESVCR